MVRFATLLLVLAVRAAFGEIAVSDLFVWEQANAQMAAATTPEEFMVTANSYNRLIMEGVFNGRVFSNLGTALVMAGDGINAEAAFKRAERFLGATPETRQGLKAALSLKEGRGNIDLPWSRTAFFWHYALPCKVRAFMAMSGWALLWVGVLCAIWVRRWGGYLWIRSLSETCLVTGGLIALLFSASTLLTLAHEKHDRATWSARQFMAQDGNAGVAP